MKRFILIAAALSVTVMAGTAVAGNAFNTEVRKPNVRNHPPQGGGHVVVATRIESAKRGCEVGREVTLYRENGSIDVPEDRDYTDSGGRALFYAYGPQAFYYVRAERKNGYGYFCPSRRSVVASAF